MEVVNGYLRRVGNFIVAKLAHNAKVILVRIAFCHVKPDAIAFRLTLLVRCKGIQYRYAIDTRRWCQQDD